MPRIVIHAARLMNVQKVKEVTDTNVMGLLNSLATDMPVVQPGRGPALPLHCSYGM
jgi:hypothetical protein